MANYKAIKKKIIFRVAGWVCATSYNQKIEMKRQKPIQGVRNDMLKFDKRKKLNVE